MTRAMLASAIACTLSIGGAAQAPPPVQDCSAAEHRQFDFWIGEWTVTNAGKPAGVNRIEAAMKGCAIFEHWAAARGGRGFSVNFYDRVEKQWVQTWIDDGGNPLHLRGGLVDGRMVMSSTPRDTAKGVDVQRITWWKAADGSIRQVWESSIDGGKSWTTAFDGTYTAKR